MNRPEDRDLLLPAERDWMRADARLRAARASLHVRRLVLGALALAGVIVFAWQIAQLDPSPIIAFAGLLATLPFLLTFTIKL